MSESQQTTEADEAWNAITERADADDISVEEACEDTVAGLNYGDMMNAGRSARENHGADVETGDAPTKGEIRTRLAEAHVFLADDGDGPFYIEQDGEVERVDLLPVQTPDSSGGSSGPSDKTVLYCLTRAETTEERVAEIREALEGAGYELRTAGNGDKYAIVLPAEEEDEAEPEVEEDKESDEESGDGSESEEDEEDDGEAEEEDEDAQEPDESEEEQEDEDGDDEDAQIDRDLARERLEERNKTSRLDDGTPSLYETATELEIDGRSDMTKDELIEAILDANDDIADE